MSRDFCVTRRVEQLRCARGLRKCRVMKGLEQFCMEDRLEVGDLPQRTGTVIGRIWSQVLEDVEARSDFIDSMWRNTDFFSHVVGETEASGVITFTHVCAASSSQWEVSCGWCVRYSWRKKKGKQREW